MNPKLTLSKKTSSELTIRFKSHKNIRQIMKNPEADN